MDKLGFRYECVLHFGLQTEKRLHFFSTRKRDQQGEDESFILLMRFCEGCDSLILTYMCRIHLAEFLATACMLSLSANRLSHYDCHRADGYAQTHTHARTHTYTHAHTRARAHAHARTCKHGRLPERTYAFIHAHTFTHRIFLIIIHVQYRPSFERPKPVDAFNVCLSCRPAVIPGILNGAFGD